MRFLPRTTLHRSTHKHEVVFSAADGLRIGFGLIWLIDAAFKWQPAFRHDFVGTLKDAAQGQPGWLHGWFRFWIDLAQPRADLLAYSTAVIETLVAVALIIGLARKLTYIGAALFSVGIWATAEGFGGPYGSSSTDIGAAVMYAVVFLGLLALNYEAGPSRFSVDYLIERRVPWWHRIAEVGHRHEDSIPPTPGDSQESEAPDRQSITPGSALARSASMSSYAVESGRRPDGAVTPQRTSALRQADGHSRDLSTSPRARVSPPHSPGRTVFGWILIAVITGSRIIARRFRGEAPPADVTSKQQSVGRLARVERRVRATVHGSSN